MEWNWFDIAFWIGISLILPFWNQFDGVFLELV